MKSLRALFGAAALASLAWGPALAEEKLSIDDLNLGEYWYGAQLTHEDLIGKVVLVEIWGSSIW